MNVSRATWKPAASIIACSSPRSYRCASSARTAWSPRSDSSAATFITRCPPGARMRWNSASTCRADVRREALQDVEAGDHVEGVVAKRHMHDAGLREPMRPVVLGELETGPREVESVRGAVLGEHRQVHAGAAAAVEQAPRWVCRDGARHERRDECAETLEPEMFAFGAASGFEQEIHQGCGSGVGAAGAGVDGWWAPEAEPVRRPSSRPRADGTRCRRARACWCAGSSPGA